ncbi:hypothetical protein S7335_1236 [Synechococcus sp. PCC 7335]|uniref:hypothetical protein n=1 Tax=Synechococcus sp. (strain ATCC 29403 / PCC 7335) TaxID=91464 RepID=UPI00017EB55F|nr:hypothetical protein [Synechococcus sp. PCC 7335]EDX82532.1 hypothetical protein S7335_1236 [Synechococcus sp. PCC 7335]
MSLDFYPAQFGCFTNPFNNQIETIKADEPADDFSVVVSMNQASAAKLIPLLALPVEDGYGEMAAADLYQRCHVVLLKNRAAIEEFTCAEDNFLSQVLKELGAGSTDGPQIINVGTDANTVEGLRRRVLLLKDLALLSMQRHGSRGYVQIC